MTRRHKGLETMIEVAERSKMQMSSRGAWTVEIKRERAPEDLQDTTTPFETIEKTWIISHYGTQVLVIQGNVLSCGTCPSSGGIDTRHRNMRVTQWYGISRSDADAINAVCAYFGLTDRWTFRPVNGGFMKTI